MPLKEANPVPDDDGPLLDETGPHSTKRRPRGPKLPMPLMQTITEYVIAYPEATIAEVGARFGVSARTVSRCRGHAIKDKLVGPSYFDRRSPEGIEAGESGHVTGAPLEETVKGYLQSAKPGEQITTEESLTALSAIARAAARDGANKLAIDAHNAFHKLKSQSKEAKLGPNPPLSYDERVERTSRILECVGVRALKAAFQVAFPEKTLEIGDKDPDAALFSDSTQNGGPDAPQEGLLEGHDQLEYP